MYLIYTVFWYDTTKQVMYFTNHQHSLDAKHAKQWFLKFDFCVFEFSRHACVSEEMSIGYDYSYCENELILQDSSIFFVSFFLNWQWVYKAGTHKNKKKLVYIIEWCEHSEHDVVI